MSVSSAVSFKAVLDWAGMIQLLKSKIKNDSVVCFNVLCLLNKDHL